MALAMDNKEPEGQLARSEIYFIEILPPEGNSTDGEGSGDGEQRRFRARFHQQNQENHPHDLRCDP